MARTGYTYDPSPATTRNPITPAEMTALLDEQGRSLLKDQARLSHFLLRVSSTIDVYRGQITQLNRDVQTLRISREGAGRAAGLSPIENARFAPPEELAKIVDEMTAERLRLATDAFTASENLRVTVLRDHNALKFALSGLTDDESLPPSVRDKLRDALRAIPAPSDLRSPAQAAIAATARATAVITPPADVAPQPLDPPATDTSSEVDAIPDRTHQDEITTPTGDSLRDLFD